MIALVPAFLLGLAGSFHCVGMCGPIAFSIPSAGNSSFSAVLGKFFYHGGRTVTYAIIGGILGLIGKGIFFTGLQQSLSIGLGLILLASLLLPGIFRLPFLQRYPMRLKALFIPLFKKRGLSFSFLIGLLNGLLPCGLVYMAVAGALATGDPLYGLLFMVAFGLGTMPMMLAASFAGKFLPMAIKVNVQKAIPVFVVLMATVFILRGMNLGIPYLSPDISGKSVSEMTQCD